MVKPLIFGFILSSVVVASWTGEAWGQMATVPPEATGTSAGSVQSSRDSEGAESGDENTTDAEEVELPYTEGEPVPLGYRVELRRSNALFIGGLTGFAMAYVVSAALVTNDDVAYDDYGLIPVAGPFIAAAALRDKDENDKQLDVSAAHRAAFIFAGVVQTMGVALTAYALATSHQVLVRDKPVPKKMTLIPTTGPTLIGLGLTLSM